MKMLQAMVGIGILCALLIVLTYEGTLPAIEKNKAEALEKAIFKVVPEMASKKNFTMDESGKLIPLAEGEEAEGKVFYAGYNENGELKVVIGHPSFKHDGFVGCCNPVAIYCLDDDIITCEKGISRVKVVDREDQLKTVVAAPKTYKKFKHSIIIDLSVDNKTGNVLTLVQGFEDVFIFEKTKGDKG